MRPEAGTTGPEPSPDAAGSGDRARPWLVAAILFAALSVLFVFTAPANRTESDDGHQFAYEIEQGTASHGTPRHVAFVPVMHGAYLAVRATGLTEDAQLVATVGNSLLAAAAVALQFLLLRLRLGLSTRSALLGAGLLAAAYGFWRFAAEVEVYSMALATGLLAVFAALSPRATTPWRVAGIAGLAALAVSAYTANALLAFAVIPAYLLAARRPRHLLLYFGVLLPALVLTVAIPYLAVRQPGESVSEAYGAAQGSPIGPESFLKAGVGAGQAVLSSGFLFSYPRFAEELSERIPDRAISDEIYLAETVTTARRATMTVTFVVALIAVVTAIVLAIPGLARSWREPAVAAMLVWLGGVVGFQILRSDTADGPELWLLALPPLLMLVTVGVAGRESAVARGTTVLAVLLAALVLHNGSGMSLIQDEHGDRNAARAAWLLDNAGPADTILTVDSSLFHRYLQYHSDASVVFLVDVVTEGGDLSELLDTGGQGGAVFATSDVFDPPGYLEYQDPDRYRALVGFGESVASQFTKVDDDDFGGVYRLEAAGA